MKKMKKIISVILAAIMSFGVISVAAAAADNDTYQITFADLPYDIAPFRDDYVADYMGYEYGTDYWFSITNNADGYININGENHYVTAGTTTDIKGAPVSIEVAKGETLEFTVSVADYIEPQTVRVIAYPTGTAAEDIAELDPLSTNLTINPGEPFEEYYLAKSQAGTYGIKPNKDLTINVSEYHLYNDCFVYNFPSSDYYTANRVIYNAEGHTPEEMYAPTEWGNTRVVYVNETLFFEVRLPKTDAYDIHYDSYTVYYMVDDLGSLAGEISGSEKVYLRYGTEGEDGYINERVCRYETETDYVDVYKIENVSPYVTIKVANTVTYTISMLADFINDFSLDNLEDLDLDSVDLSPMLDLMLRLLNLIVKMLNAFGMNVSLGDLVG